MAGGRVVTAGGKVFMACGPLSCRRERGDDAFEQLASLILAELCDNRDIPQSRVREVPAFYGILLRHEHGQLVAKIQIRRDEGMMVGERMPDNIHTVGAQISEKARGMPYSCDGMNPLAAKMFQRKRSSKLIEALRAIARQHHRERIAEVRQ